MIKQYFKQALAQLRQHPLISVISIAGTALSIFLILRQSPQIPIVELVIKIFR